MAPSVTVRLLLWLSLLAAGCFGAPVPAIDDAAYGRGADLAPLCSGNNDGVIEFGELGFPVGLTVRYLVNPPGSTVAVVTDGAASADGPEWDLRSTAGEVHDFTLLSPAGAWWGSSFPGATYAVTSDVGSGTLGVFRVTPDALLLLGFASVEPNQTLAVYDQPIASLRFPVHSGDGWVTGAKIAGGKIGGKPFSSSDTYRITVDAVGVATLPYLRFDHTLRVRVDLTQALPGGISVSHIQYLLYHECYGELGRMVSNPNETDGSFTIASEFRRLAL